MLYLKDKARNSKTVHNYTLSCLKNLPPKQCLVSVFSCKFAVILVSWINSVLVLVGFVVDKKKNITLMLLEVEQVEIIHLLFSQCHQVKPGSNMCMKNRHTLNDICVSVHVCVDSCARTHYV